MRWLQWVVFLHRKSFNLWSTETLWREDQTENRFNTKENVLILFHFTENLLHFSCPVGEATHLWSYWKALASSARHNITSNKQKKKSTSYANLCARCLCVSAWIAGDWTWWWGKVKVWKIAGPSWLHCRLLLLLLLLFCFMVSLA